MMMLWLSCHNNHQVKNVEAQNMDTIAKVTRQIPNIIDEEIGRVVNSFYDWYNENDHPYYAVIEDEKSHKCILDTLTFFKKLKELDVFSVKFFQKEQERLSPCANFIAAVDYEEYTNADAYDYDEFCDHFSFMYWIRSQEPFEKVITEKTKKINDKMAIAEVFGYYEYPSQEKFLLSEVHLEKENEQWKITEIILK